MDLNRKQWVDIFFHPAALATLLLIVVHQGVIASSSYFLTKIIEVFQNSGNYRSYLFAYLFAMTFPYLPGCASLVTLRLWINKAHQRFTQRIAKVSFGLTEKHRNQSLQERVESVIARNSFIVLEDYLNFFHGFVGFLLNSLLSILVLGFLLPGNLLVGYFSSLALCAVIVILIRKFISRCSVNVENKYIAYSDILSKAWDNTTLGNVHNHSSWVRRRDVFAKSYYGESSKLVFFKQSGNLLLATTSLCPTIYLLVYAVQSNSATPGLIAAIVVNLTRIFHILNSLSTLVYQILDWSSMSARLQVLFDVEKSLMEETELPTLPNGKFNLNGKPVDDFNYILTMLSMSSHGRFTIRGENGSGKSTLLQMLKKNLSNDAVYIPTQQGKLSWDSDCRSLSTGQKMLVQLKEIACILEVKYLLLDEWDANLDQVNKAHADNFLDELSQEKVVVEVRH